MKNCNTIFFSDVFLWFVGVFSEPKLLPFGNASVLKTKRPPYPLQAPTKNHIFFKKCFVFFEPQVIERRFAHQIKALFKPDLMIPNSKWFEHQRAFCAPYYKFFSSAHIWHVIAFQTWKLFHSIQLVESFNLIY